MSRLRPVLGLLLALVPLACTSSTDPDSTDSESGARPLVVATSSIVADIVRRVGDDSFDVVSVIPNGFDSHTYEPKPSEIEMIADADLVVMASADLNEKITQLVELSTDDSNVLDLNAASLAAEDFITKASSSRSNPHTWTDPLLVAKWVPVLEARLVSAGILPASEAAAGAASFLAELERLDAAIRAALRTVPETERRLVVYHDAWEYFARRYDVELVGVLQAVNFAEPSAAELSALSEEIRRLGVRAFFGSEVFPSDVLEALERESGARYIPDLADDELPGAPGDPDHGYVPLMEANLALLLQGLRP